MGDSKVYVTFGPGETPIQCRRSRMNCNGCYACVEVDPILLNVVRHNLDTASRDAVFAAQRETRRMEGSTAEEAVAVCDNFLPLIRFTFLISSV